MIDNNHASGPASGYIEPKPKGTEGVSATGETKKPISTSFEDWWDSDASKAIQKESQESLERAVGKYYMLPDKDKYDMVQAICHIMCKAEKEGTSHRGLQDALGIYPEGFWIFELMTVHNALWSYYHDERQKQELKDNLDALEKFTENKRDH
jgi:hypothetical protein